MGLIKKIITFAIILAVILLVWGFIGGSQASDIGVTCDIGGETLCWKWHKNIVGDIQDGLSALGNVVKDNLQKIN